MEPDGARWSPMEPDGARWIPMGPDGAGWGPIEPDGAGWSRMERDGAPWGRMGPRFILQCDAVYAELVSDIFLSAAREIQRALILGCRQLQPFIFPPSHCRVRREKGIDYR